MQGYFAITFIAFILIGCGNFESQKRSFDASSNGSIGVQEDAGLTNLDIEPYQGEPFTIVEPAEGAEVLPVFSFKGYCTPGNTLLITANDLLNARTPECGVDGFFEVNLMLTGGLGRKTINITLMSSANEILSEHTRTVEAVAVVEPPPPPPVLNGATLYAINCASCHGAINNTEKPGRSADQIAGAIDNVQAMAGLAGMSDEQIQAIADALAN